MLALRLAKPRRRGYELLCLGSHSDDLEIGCSGTIMRLQRELPVARVTWVVLSGVAQRALEAKKAARMIFGRKPGVRFVQGTFRDAFFPHTAGPIKEFFEKLKQETEPDLIFTHYREDRHQDHRLVSELTYQTFRDHLILEYEVLKMDGDIGQPNVYVPLDERTVDRKLAVLERCFASQRNRRWFSQDAFRGLMRIRGVEGLSPTGLAEAFYGRKLSL